MKRYLIIIFATLFLTNCATIAPKFMKAKSGKLSTKPLAMDADKYFWDNFHAGNYDSIPKILEQLTNAYYQNNQDYKLAAHIGFTNAWGLAEGSRLENSSARVTDHSTMAIRYFEEAIRLAPEKDWRYVGFLSSMKMAEGSIHNDMKRMTEGFFNMKKAVKKYPEFNLFTAAYARGMNPNPNFRKKAIDMLWKNIEVCLGEKMDRKNFDFRKFMGQKELIGKMSACWNTWIAPHNLEGFLLVLGDFEFKEGNYEIAKLVYENATYIEEFEEWDYKEIIHQRLAEVETVIASKKDFKEVEFTKFPNCMICHQEKDMVFSPKDVHTTYPNPMVSSHLRKPSISN